MKSDFDRLFPEVTVTMLHTELGGCLQPQHTLSGLLFSREKMAQHPRELVLLMECEDWCWVRPNDTTLWASPWGPLELTHPECGFFAVQPGREVILNPTGSGLALGDDFGMDPGPCSWGRSHRLTLMDLIDWWPSFEPELKINSKAQQKKSDLMLSLFKSTRGSTASEKSEEPLLQKVFAAMIFEISQVMESPRICLKGAMADYFLRVLPSQAPKNWEWFKE